jgi:pyridoxine 5-phosphate synthase
MSVVLGVNLDHIATLREVRGVDYPRPFDGAMICEKCRAHGVTLHLREDRRHIQEYDVIEIKKVLSHCSLNLEMALSNEIIEFAKKILPYMVTIVPEKREELTTEGGLDVRQNVDKIGSLTRDFHLRGILVSLFIEPDREMVKLSKVTGADYIEIHTGTYADARGAAVESELARVLDAADFAVENGLRVNAGHGLNYDNIGPILGMKGLEEVNIGHSIISRAVLVGLERAIREMQDLLAGKKSC